MSSQSVFEWLSDRLAEERQLLERRHGRLLEDFQEFHMAETQAYECPPFLAPNTSGTAPLQCTQLKNTNRHSEDQIGPDIDENICQQRDHETHVGSKPNIDWLNSSTFTAKTRVGKLVTHRYFELFFATLIGINMLVMAAEMQFTGMEDGWIIGYAGYTHISGYWYDVCEVLDWAFGILYTVEIFLKLIGLRQAFFEPWNVFDTSVVAIFYVEKLGLLHIPINTMVLRLFRLLKVLRLLRLVHEIAGLRQLLLMVTALKGSLHMLAWATMLLLGLQTVFAFLLNQLLKEFVILNDDISTPTRLECFRYFGTFARAIFSMFELTLGNWIPISRFLAEEVHMAFVTFAIFYKLTLGFAVVGVVNACFIKETFKNISSDRTMMVIEKASEKKGFEREMLKFLEQADFNSDGELTQAEFVKVCSNPNTKMWLAAQGLDASEAEKLFVLMDDGSGDLEASELVKGVAKLKGPARSLDLALAETDRVMRERELLDKLEHILPNLDAQRHTEEALLNSSQSIIVSTQGSAEENITHV